MARFLYYYLRSMRLYYGFVTGTTVLWGVMHASPINYAPSVNPLSRLDAKAVAALAVGFLAWGVNQVFSDYLDRKEDAVNAPHRPMVTGALAAKPALALSAVLMLLIGAVSLWMSPWALLMLGIGGVLNLAYSRLKCVPVVNIVVYGCAISCCAFYGIAAVRGNLRSTAPEPLEDVMDIALLVLPVHILMCHNSYYKDVPGDRAAGIRTLQTLFPQQFSFLVTFLLACGILFFGLLAIIPAGKEWLHTGMQQKELLHSCLQAEVPLIAAIQFIGGLFLLGLLFRALERRRYHRATCLNCQLCVAMLYPWMPQKPELLAVELLSLAIIQLLFFWYRDEKE